MSAVYITNEEKARLKKILDTHGLQKTFAEKAKTRRESLYGLIRNGYAQAKVVLRVREALSAEGVASSDTILSIVAQEYGTTTIDISQGGSKARTPLLNEARQAAAFVLQKVTGYDVYKIADILGYSSRTGAIKAIETISNRMDVDPILRKKVWRLVNNVSH